MEERKIKSIEDLVAKCRADGMDNFIALAGDGDSKTVFIGEGDYDGAVVTIAAVLYQREDILELFENAIEIVYQLRKQNKNIN